MTMSAILPRPTAWGLLACLTALLLSGLALGAEDKEKMMNVDAAFVGFSGTFEGTMVDRKSNGKTVGLTVTKAEPDAASQVKDGKKLEGKPVTTGVRWEKKDGAWTPIQADLDFVLGLKPGDAIVVEVKYYDKFGGFRMSAAPKRK